MARDHRLTTDNNKKMVLAEGFVIGEGRVEQ
jgi:hypothetical protein